MKLLEAVKENINLEDRRIHILKKSKTDNTKNFKQAFRIIAEDSGKESDFKVFLNLIISLKLIFIVWNLN